MDSTRYYTLNTSAHGGSIMVDINNSSLESGNLQLSNGHSHVHPHKAIFWTWITAALLFTISMLPLRSSATMLSASTATWRTHSSISALSHVNIWMSSNLQQCGCGSEGAARKVVNHRLDVDGCAICPHPQKPATWVSFWTFVLVTH